MFVNNSYKNRSDMISFINNHFINSQAIGLNSEIKRIFSNFLEDI